jgi:hypothetical protein
MVKVDYTRDTYNMCLCGGCPVNRSSDCVRKQEKALEPWYERIEKEDLLPDGKDMPGIYCATGKSTCEDLGGTKSCLCPACPVNIEWHLSNNYYCLKGSAEEVG